MREGSPVLSIIVPVQNSEAWIDEMLETVTHQGLRDFEVILVENGSSDATVDVIERRAVVDDRLKIVRSTAGSAAGARNDGVSRAAGRYLAFADSDDLVPDGAYRSMLDALESSGSDMVIGNHLKFSAHRTWSPTKRWYPFDGVRLGVRPRDVPELLSGRPCWNRMFRRSFWERAGLSFPEIPSVEDIEPMTRAFVAAEAIDVVPECVYLYRDRGDSSSLSVRADAAVTIRYLEQELECAALVEHDQGLRAKHAEIVLDADGWSHLHRFLSTDPDDRTMAEVARATDTLTASMRLDGLSEIAPSRRVLWELVLNGEWRAARSFVTESAGRSGTHRVAAWVAAVTVLLSIEPRTALALLRDGLVPALVNDADGLETEWLAERLTAFRTVDPGKTGSTLVDAMIDAVRSGAYEAVRDVSAIRLLVPLVVDHVEATETALVIGGPADLGPRGLEATIKFSGPWDTDSAVSSAAVGGRWDAEVTADALVPGRYAVTVSFAGVLGDFPVVTARMPLPPVGEDMPIQPLADRKHGWRFLVDRRPARRRRVSALLSKVVRKR